MSRRILLTGATGLVGAQLLTDLREHTGDAEIVATSRRGAPDDGVVSWDLTAPGVPAALGGPWDVIVNNAADVRWTMAPAEAHRANVQSVDGLAKIAGPETHVVHVSTAYVTGRAGTIGSTDLGDYRNTYEWSKAAGERLAAERFERLTVVRPSLITGRRGDGGAARFAGLYVLLRGIASSTIPAVPAATGAYCDVIPVDDLTAVLADVALSDAPGAGERPVLTVAGGEQAPRVETVVPAMVDALNAWRAARGIEPFGQPKLIQPDAWDRFFLAFAREHLTPRQQRALDLLRAYEPYLQIVEPRPATHVITDVLPTVIASSTAWCERFARLAAMPPRPWQARRDHAEATA